MILLEVTPNKYDAVVSEVAGLDAVRWVGLMSGPFDVLIEAMLPSGEDLRDLLLERLAGIEGITRMQTAQVLEVAKIAFDWPRMLGAEFSYQEGESMLARDRRLLSLFSRAFGAALLIGACVAPRSPPRPPRRRWC